MRKFNITVNGKTYAVDVEEVGGVSAPTPAPAAAPGSRSSSRTGTRSRKESSRSGCRRNNSKISYARNDSICKGKRGRYSEE